MTESDSDFFSDPIRHNHTTMANEFMAVAKECAQKFSLDKVMPNASVLVKDGKIIGLAANGSNYHDTHECERVRLKVPTGQGYELCEGCHPRNHSEFKSVADAKIKGHDTVGSVLYIWGHWWLCRWCRDHLYNVGVREVFILEDAHILFNKNKDANIIGKQFQ